MPRPRALVLLLGAILAFGAGVPSVASATNPRSTTVQKVFPSAVRLELVVGEEVLRSASGIAFARAQGQTYVLTNAHVVVPDKAWKTKEFALRVLPGRGGGRLQGRVVALGHAPEMDLAVVAVTSDDLPVTLLAGDDALELGDDLVVIGAPFGRGLSVAAGIVSQIEYDFAENAAAPRIPKALKTDAAIGYGSSGGGVFDVPGGRLIGLVEGYRTARVAFGKEEGYAFDVPMPGETFVAPAAKIRRFLADRGLGALVGIRTGAGILTTHR